MRASTSHANMIFQKVRITRNNFEECEEELRGQLSDGVFENSKVGKVVEMDKLEISDKVMDAIAALMDDEIRERVHYELAPCSNEAFLKRYCELQPEFIDVLKNEFSIELD